MVFSIERFGPAATATAGLGLCLITVAVTVTGSASDAVWLEAVARSLMVAVPLAVGAYALHRPPFERFGRLLILAGVAWFFTTLAISDDALVYSVGRVAGWLAEPVLLFLLLAFPTGRLETRVDRALVAAALFVVLVLYLPTALMVERFPVPAPWSSCDAGCPDNAFMVLSAEPGVIGDVVRPLREVVTILLFGAVALRLAWRIRGASRLTRRTLTPVFAVATLRYAAYALLIVGRAADPGSAWVDAGVWLLAISVPLLAIAFLVGLARWWLFVAVSGQRLAARLQGHPGPDDLRAALAGAFGDPALDIVYRVDGRWTDADGAPRALPALPPSRCLTEIRDGDLLVAAIVHEAALRDDRAFIDTATSYALMALDNHRLAAQASALLSEVQASRARIQAAADDERRRIERDLHDGAQQRLVALRIKLELAAERSNGDGSGAELLRGFGDEVEEALDEVRSLARGIYPGPLADRGLVEALRAAGLRCPLATSVLAAGVGRYPREIETAAYFCCLEAMQNAGKHARGATAVVVDLFDNGALCMQVRDDGAGFDPGAVTSGVGFTSMRDRLAAVGGALSIVSAPGRGTRVTGTIPLPAVRRPAPAPAAPPG